MMKTDYLFSRVKRTFGLSAPVKDTNRRRLMIQPSDPKKVTNGGNRSNKNTIVESAYNL